MNIIIDIRNSYEYKIGHIPNAININSVELLATPEKYLNKSKKYFIYCQSGIRSEKVVSVLNQMGYNTVNIKGGYQNYLLRN